MFLGATIAVGAAFVGLGQSYPFQSNYSVTNSKTSLTLLYQNNLNGSDDINHVGALLLDAVPQASAAGACAAVNEKLLTKSVLQQHQSDFLRSLSYEAFAGYSDSNQQYYIQDGVVDVSEGANQLSFPARINSHAQLPVLCTQSANNGSSSAAPVNGTEVTVASTGNAYIGYRNQKSFRFLGIPYAEPPQRWVYTTPYSQQGQTIRATQYGSQCAQTGSGSENCLFLNIQTPYIPKANSKAHLRPVMFWIHGGGFTGGSGADPLSDGGNLASREDLVIVTINYRLSTLGFLAIPGTNITGNYGIADQILALQWTINNIASFGGDPNHITIIGESAGAGSVRTLLGSPKAIGKYQAAVAMSNLGGGVDLGLSGDYGTTYSSYYTIAQSYNVSGPQIFSAAGCNSTSLDAEIACLKQVPALTLVGLSAVARYVVQDGTYVNTEQLIVSTRNGSTAHVPVIFGVARNDGASFSTYPKTPVANESAGIQAALGISASYAQDIINSGLFPFYNSGNLTLDAFNVSQRVATDKTFRCIDEATVYAGAKSGVFERAYFYEFDRTIAGYDPNNLGGPPATPGYPNGNPNLPYFRYHGADMPWVFGNIDPIRDVNDLYSVQLVSGYFAEFVKSGQPNPPLDYLRVRGYDTSIQAIERTGSWDEVSGEEGPIRVFDYPGHAQGFRETAQCTFLNLTLDYYFEGGR